jgi:hypothetical protein
MRHRAKLRRRLIGVAGTPRAALAALALCILTASIALSPALARAAVTHKFLSQITEVPAVGPHGESVPIAGNLRAVNAETADSGQLFVSEGEVLFGEQGCKEAVCFRVDQFGGTSGAFELQFERPPFEEPPKQPAPLHFPIFGMGVLHSTGEVFVGASNGVGVFDHAGKLLKVWNGSDTPFKSFGEQATSIAVDNAAGLVYVADAIPPRSESTFRWSEVVDVFKAEPGGEEKYVTQLTRPEAGVPFEFNDSGRGGGLAVDPANGDLLVSSFTPTQTVDLFEPSGSKYVLVRTLTGSPNGPFTAISGVAVDPSGDIYVLQRFTEDVVDQFSFAGEYLGRITSTSTSPIQSAASLAVDSATGQVYVGDGRGGRRGSGSSLNFGAVDVFGPTLVIPDVETQPASAVQPFAATLNGTVNPDNEGPATCQFAWGTSPAFGEIAPCEPETVPNGNTPVPVHAQLTDKLQPDTTYFYRLQATNQNEANPGEPRQTKHFTTPGPGFRGLAVSAVTGDSATLEATINPHGAPTSYYFQYGPTTAYGSEAPAPPGNPIGSGTADVEVTPQHVAGLAPGTVYHYRAVAVSEIEEEPGVKAPVTFYGPDQNFTTQPAGVFGLPDGREWEMVSPTQKQGSLIVPIGESTPIQASVSGDAITYPTHSPTEAETLGYANFVQVISSRGAGSWSSRDITVPHELATGVSVGVGNEYRFSSEDLSRGVVQPFGSFVPALSPEATEQTAFVHSNYSAGSPTAFCTTHCFTPLVTANNTLEGVAFGEQSLVGVGKCPPVPICGPLAVGASPDLEHIILQSKVGLTEAPEDHGGLYEWSAGRLQLVSVLPDGTPAKTAEFGFSHIARSGVSPDGQRVVWSSFDAGAHHLFLRDVSHPESVELNNGLSGAPEFQAANRQTTRVFFTENGDLYVYDSETGQRTQLTTAAKVKGLIAGISEDGTSAYFVANGELTKGEGAVNGNCEEAGATPTQRCNLYQLHQAGAAWEPRLIAVLSASDFPDFSKDLPGLTARVSPDGRYLAFMSLLPLTGYDNRDAVSGEPDAEVFLYNATDRHLTCASCKPTGARPHGIESSELTVSGPVQGFGNDAWIAASVPGWTEYHLGTSVYQSRYLSDSGRLFFNSSDALSPQDDNGTEDVYQWEPPGVGSCEVGGAGYDSRSGGCVGLISKGSSREESGFLDASETGGDVFFTTTAKLTPQDADTAYDIYDAHECTPASPCIAPPAEPPPPCSTEASCKASPTPQPAIFGPAASATFQGAGNLIAELASPPPRPKPLTTAQKLAKALTGCRKTYKHSKKRRGRCEAEARRRYRATGAKKANRKRRTR